MKKLFYTSKENQRFDKISDPTSDTKGLAIFVIYCLILSVGIFGYLISLFRKELGTEGTKTFTISRSLAKGSKPGIVVFIALSLLPTIFLILIRGPVKLRTFRIFLIVLAYSLVISLPWLTVDYNKDLHYSLAGVIFSCIFIFEMITYWFLYKKYPHLKIPIIFLIVLGVYFTYRSFSFCFNR